MATKRRAPTMSQVKRISAELEQLEIEYTRKVEAIAARARGLILPYFETRGLEYVTGNGTWYIDDESGKSIDDDDLPLPIREVLTLPVQQSNCLGFYVDNIKRSEAGAQEGK